MKRFSIMTGDIKQTEIVAETPESALEEWERLRRLSPSGVIQDESGKPFRRSPKTQALEVPANE